MSARKNPSALIALGKRCERGLRRLRHGLRDARAAVSLLRAAGGVFRADIGLVSGDVTDREWYRIGAWAAISQGLSRGRDQ
ncbi:MAG: hypothetical protein ACKOWG_09580, partial [Planctomycetia bacterium]